MDTTTPTTAPALEITAPETDVSPTLEPVTPTTTPTPIADIDLVHELEDDIVTLVEERDELQERVKELEADVASLHEDQALKTMSMVAMTVLYICILLAVTDITNNPEL